MTVIMLGGRKEAGKDAVADYLVDTHGFVKVGMSDPVLEMLLTLNPIVATIENEDGSDYAVRAQDAVHMAGYVEAKQIPEFRRIMQVLGTEVIRDQVDANYWVKRMAYTVTELQKQGKDVVVTGIRFRNELDVSKLFSNPQTWWISRPEKEAVSDGHASEKSLTAADFDEIVLNDGTLAELYSKVNGRL